MPRLLQIIAVVMCLLAARPSRAFSLLGPFETWQTAALGYSPTGADIGAPKNITEEYRWNTPVITYAFDSSFLNYFGNEGAAAVDAAFNIINSLPDLTSLKSDLSEFPLIDPATGASTTYRDSRRVNLRAEADNLVDIKSVALGVIVEELGLASPSRWTWALRDRKIIGANPGVTNYLTIQRNFDPVTFAPSKYVNGSRYTYQIVEFQNPNFSDAIESTVDPEHRIHSFSSLADIPGSLLGQGLTTGTFYTYLTRDDIGGLRYLYQANNVNREPFAPGTQAFVVDRSNGFISLTNQDLTLLSLRSATASPELLGSFYPGLIITQALPNVSTIQSNIPVVVTQLVSQIFSTNYSTPVIVSNIDLTTFSSVTLTSAPAALTANLQAAFPGVQGFDQLILLSTNFSSTSVLRVASIVLTNAPRQPFDDVFTTNFIFLTNYVVTPEIRYHYTFRNVVTNYFSATTAARRVVTGLAKEPWSDALNPVYKTSTTELNLPLPSGAVTIVPTNLVSYVFTGFNTTNVFPITNVNGLFSTNFVDLNTGLQRTVARYELWYFTNVQYVAYPVEFLATPFVTNVFVTNAFITTNIITYNYKYANVLTNYHAPSTPATRTRYQVVADPTNPLFNQTNVLALEPVTLPVPSGGFIIDTNQTGFEYSGFSNVVVLSVTNTVFDIVDASGVRTVEEVVYNFTNTVSLVFPFVLVPAPASALRPGISKLKFQKISGSDGTFLYTNRYTAGFYTNGVLTNGVFLNVQTQPDILIRARDLGTFADSVFPVQYVRSSGFVNNGPLNSPTDPNQGGPGSVFGTITIDFNKIGPSLINEFPGFVTEASALALRLQPFVWGSFDGSTNAPIVFPKDISLEQIESIITSGGPVP